MIQGNEEKNSAIPSPETGNVTLNAAHTPTPWRVELERGIRRVRSSDNRIVATVESMLNGINNDEKEAEADANAAFIVHATNAHDALVEALRNIQGVGHVSVRPATDAALQRANDKLDQVMEWATAALAIKEES